MRSHKSVYKILREIYNKHRRKYPENGDSDQICCMWSTNDPPDIIDDTEPINDIESAFDIVIDEDEALNLYDMYLEEAAKQILKIKNRN